MEMLRGFVSTKGTEGKDYCLKLIKSVYGHKAAPLLWFKHSTKKLELTQFKHDECLWCGKNLIFGQYVDDCGISAPDQAMINKFVKDV